MKDSVEVQLPGSDRLFIVLRMEEPSDHISLTPLDDILLDFGHCPTIENLVSGFPGALIAGSTHVVNCPIASNTD